MPAHVILLPTKLVAPKPRRDWLPRPKLGGRLAGLREYPLTLVTAGPGYGKSTAVAAALAEMAIPHAWYSVGEDDASGYVFCCYLAGAVEQLFPGAGAEAAALLAGREGSRPWLAAADALLKALAVQSPRDAVLVVDDYHLVAGNQEVEALVGRLLAYQPDWLHVAVLSRAHVDLPEVARRRARAEVLEVDERDLAFSREEMKEYFDKMHRYALNSSDLAHLARITEGWVMALQLIGQGVGGGTVNLPLAESAGTLEALFEFLARDVLEKQCRAMQGFLLQSVVLDEMDPGSLRAVLGDAYHPDLLKKLDRCGLFVVNLGDNVFRYHHLFHDFLRREAAADAGTWKRLQDRAADYYRSEGLAEKAVEHLLQAGREEAAAGLLAEVAMEWVQAGRFQTLFRFLDRIPRHAAARQPWLLVARGEASRLACDYQGALACYVEAEAAAAKTGERLGRSAALKGMAEVYLDTIHPVLAEEYLRRAAKALTERDTQERAAIVALMAENKINQGQPRHAQRYQRLAKEMLHMASRGDPDARLLLRTGRLEAAVRLLERKADQERGRYHPPRSFRETPLLLSLCYTFMGRQEKALAAAQEGIRIGGMLNSPFVEAIGYARLGHARQLEELSPNRALECYHKALEISDRLGVVRGRTEVMMGLCLVHGAAGDWAAAERCGLEGLRVAEQVRDRWFAGILRLCLGAAAASCRKPALAEEYLSAAGEQLRRSGDSHGLAVTRWWLAHLYHHAGRRHEFALAAGELLDLCQNHGYDFLLRERTLLGARDARMSVPLLVEARRRDIRSDCAAWLLEKLGVCDALPQPGYTLRVQTLGKFKVWRGDAEITAREWQREKARQMFQLFLTRRKGLLHREQIMALLWPDASPEVAARDFKVALNALMNALEPDRPPRSGSSYVLREGSTYGFNLAGGYWLDAGEFESLVASGQEAVETAPDQAVAFLQRALELYRGDYLQEVLYDEWCLEERERLAVMYLKAAATLAGLLAKRGDYASCISWTEKILAKDNCWEEAYRLQMLCYARLNNRGMVARVYEKCVQTMQKELGVTPSIHTAKLYRKITGAGQAREGL
ncbi:hypothetical protein SY88_17010 [Clostridiales bacterium PH28_bin88]|nr:hypothetical protein SY88_17010 [Clostridiales bacterium PH28_bin88]